MAAHCPSKSTTACSNPNNVSQSRAALASLAAEMVVTVMKAARAVVSEAPEATAEMAIQCTTRRTTHIQFRLAGNTSPRHRRRKCRRHSRCRTTRVQTVQEKSEGSRIEGGSSRQGLACARIRYKGCREMAFRNEAARAERRAPRRLKSTARVRNVKLLTVTAGKSCIPQSSVARALQHTPVARVSLVLFSA